VFRKVKKIKKPKVNMLEEHSVSISEDEESKTKGPQPGYIGLQKGNKSKCSTCLTTFRPWTIENSSLKAFKKARYT
jgi:hypothetical protein